MPKRWPLCILLCLALALASVQSLYAYIGAWAPTNMRDISVGSNFTCGIGDGKAYCWGSNSAGQIGSGATSASDVLLPQAVDASGVLNGKTVTDITAGTNHACAVADSKVYCWGVNSSGQLGNGDSANKATKRSPVAVVDGAMPAGAQVTRVTAGAYHTCAIAGGAAYCWGGGTNYALGNGSNANQFAPVLVTSSDTVAGGVTDISAGDAHTCGVAGGLAYCWGSGANGRLGDGATANNTTPEQVSNITGVTSIAAGTAHSCAVANNKAYCWGTNSNGQIGNNSTSGTYSTPQLVYASAGPLQNASVKRVATGGNKSCAINANNNAVSCWGDLYPGNGTTSGNSKAPAQITMTGAMSGATPVDVHVSSTHDCVVTANKAYCWGKNTNGQLGNNASSNTASPAPVEVLAQDDAVQTNFRVYANANSLAPGSPLAASDNVAQLTSDNMPFRMRIAMRTRGNTPVDLPASAMTLKLQFAAKSASTCAAQTGYADVTASTAIAWNTNANAANNSVIATNSNDPETGGTNVMQNYQSAAGTFQNNARIPSGNYGIWDFSLKENATPLGARYCMRLVNSDGASVGNYDRYPEVRAYNGDLSVGFFDASDASVAQPSIAMSSVKVISTCQSSSGTLGIASQKLRVNNSTGSGGWSVSVASVGGVSDAWTSTKGNQYDYNDPSGSPAGCNSGSDGDGLAGQLSVNPSGSTMTPKSGCSTSGISRGSTSAFSQNVIDSISLATAASGVATGCYWDFTGITLSQQIPKYQPAGSYALNLSITAVSQ